MEIEEDIQVIEIDENEDLKNMALQTLLKGETGPQGIKGETGEKGPQGEQGERGDIGPQGIQGLKGDKGETGDKGNDGYTPIKGIDYWTETDKNEIKNYVDNSTIDLEKILQDILEAIQSGVSASMVIEEIEQLIVSYFENKTVEEVEAL